MVSLPPVRGVSMLSAPIVSLADASNVTLRDITIESGRSDLVDMVLRTAAKEGLLESDDSGLGITLDRLNDGAPVWPSAITPYIYGYIIHEMMTEVAGPTAPGDVSIRSSGSFPFLINGVARRAIGTDYYALWEKAVARLKAVALKDLGTIRSSPVTSFSQLTHVGRFTSGPAVSHDGTSIYYIRDSYHDAKGISRLDVRTGKSQDLSDWYFGGSTRLTRAGKWIFYSRLDRFEEYKFFSDAYAFDPTTGEELKLTDGRRAIDPDASPDLKMGKYGIEQGSITYVKNIEDGNQALAIWDGKLERVLYAGERFERLDQPSWGHGPAADWILFTLKVNGANERLVAVNSKTGLFKTVTSHPSPAFRINEVTPFWTSAGDLLYSGSSGGIFNIYRLSWAEVRRALAGEHFHVHPEKLTHLETGAFFPFELGEKLGAVVYGPAGFDLAVLDELPKDKPHKIPQLESLHTKIHLDPAAKAVAEIKELTPEDTEVDTPDPKEDYPEGTPVSYSVFPTLLPQYWYPFVQKVTDGWNLGLTTSGLDALERHIYDLQLVYDSRASFPVFTLRYQYGGLYPAIAVSVDQENKYLGVFQQSNRIDTTGVSFVFPINFWNVSFGGTWNQSRFFNDQANSGGIQAKLSHANPEVHPDSIDQDAGDSGHRAEAVFSGYFIGDSQFSSIEARWDQRWRMPSSQQFFRVFANGAHATNIALSALYFVGGGESTITELQSYLIRGYVPGVVLGRDIATLNLEYWLPLKEVFHGHGTLPVFYQRTKLKLFADTGSGEYVAGTPDHFSRWPVGVGFQLLQDFKVLYKLPITLGLGFDWGLNADLRGERQLLLGLYSRFN